MKKILCFFSFLLLAVVTGTVANCAEVRIVDVQKVMAVSKAAEAGRQHLAEARKVLEKGYADLQKAWEKAPKNEREAALAEGALALNRQMRLEEQAVTNVVSEMMLQEIKKWRRANKIAIILPRQNALDADDALDISLIIIGEMDKQQPKFAALPTVSVKTPPTPAPAVQQPAKPVAKPAPKKQPVKQPR